MSSEMERVTGPDPVTTSVVTVQPAWYQKTLVVLMIFYLLSMPVTAYIVTTRWPDGSSITFNRTVFCKQEQVNGRILAPECVKILNDAENK